MMKTLKGLTVTIMLLTTLSVSCSTLANYSLTPLNKRHLRISLDGAYTEYRWLEPVCLHRVLKMCVYYKQVPHIERDFDLTKAEDRKKLNDMGFELSIRERP